MYSSIRLFVPGAARSNVCSLSNSGAFVEFGEGFFDFLSTGCAALCDFRDEGPFLAVRPFPTPLFSPTPLFERCPVPPPLLFLIF